MRTWWALLLLVPLAACGSDGLPRAEVSDGFLDDKVVALTASTAYDDGRLRGQVVFVDAKGRLSSVPTAGMDNGRIVAARGRVFFSDATRERSVGATTRATPRGRAEQVQEALHVLRDGRRVSVYNVGFTDDGGYRFDVATTAGGETEVSRVPHMIYASASCADDRVLAVAAASPDQDTGPYLLLDLTARPEKRVLGRWSPSMRTEPPVALACDGSTARFTVGRTDGSGVVTSSAVVSWASSGSVRVRPVRGLKDPEFPYWTPVSDSRGLTGADATGRVWRVEYADGVARRVLDLNLKGPGNASTQVVLRHGLVYALDVDDAGRAELVVRDLSTRAVVARRSVDQAFATLADDGMSVTDLAVVRPAPDW
ncbi:MAG: hypothetical protein PGN07_00610 [Aeromicrobium erythreum]